MEILEGFDGFKKIKELNDKMIQIKEEIKDKIKSLPDNSDIKRIDDKSFIINKSDLDNKLSLSPEAYDYKKQYQLISDHLDKIKLANIEAELLKIIKEEKLNITKKPYIAHSHSIPISKVVISYLKKLIE